MNIQQIKTLEQIRQFLVPYCWLLTPTSHSHNPAVPKNGKVIRKQQTIHGFSGIYTQEDVMLLAAIDTLHDTPTLRACLHPL